MATIRERRKGGATVYNVQVRMAGFPSRTATFPTRRLAERWAKTVEAEMIEGRHFRSTAARRRSVADAIDRYTETEIPKKRHGGMHRAYLPWWKKRLGATKLAAVSPALLVECRDELMRGKYVRAKPESMRSTFKGEKAPQYQRSAATVNRYLAALSHVFTVARKEWHWVGTNPFDGVAKLPEGKGRVRALSDQERNALLAETAKDAALHTFVVLALSTACRAGELLKLEWKDVDLKDGRLLFRETKNATPRVAWISGEVLGLVREYAKDRSITGRAFANSRGGAYDYDKPFRTAVDAAGIQNLRFHDLRHTAATYLAQAGATEQQLRAIGGWKSNVVARYVHLAAEDAKSALEKLAEKIAGNPAK